MDIKLFSYNVVNLPYVFACVYYFILFLIPTKRLSDACRDVYILYIISSISSRSAGTTTVVNGIGPKLLSCRRVFRVRGDLSPLSRSLIPVELLMVFQRHRWKFMAYAICPNTFLIRRPRTKIDGRYNIYFFSVIPAITTIMSIKY